MSETLSWYFELVDRISGPANKMSEALEQTGSATKQVGEVMERVDSAMKSVGLILERVEGSMREYGQATERANAALMKTAKASEQAGAAVKRTGSAMKDAKKESGAFGQFLGGAFGVSLGGPAAWGAAAAAAATKVLDIGKGVAGMVADGGKFALDALQFKESTLASLRVLLGTEEAAQRIFGQASSMASKTPFAMGDVLRGYKQLLSAGFGEKEVPLVFQAVGDVASFNDFSPQVIDSLSRAFSQIKGKARLQMEELQQVLEASGGAIRRSDVFEQIAKDIGVSVRDVDKAISTGRVSDEVGIFAILKAIEKTSGGAVGGAMLAQSKTIGGLFSTLADLPRQLFLEMDLSNLPGFAAVKGAVENVIKLFDASSGRLKGVVGSAFNDLFVGVFGDFAGEAGFGNLERLLNRSLEIGKTVWEFVKGIGSGISGLIEGFAAGFSPAVALMSSGDKWKAFADGLNAVGRALGFVVGAIESLWVAVSKLAGPLRWLDEIGSFSSKLPGADIPTVRALKAQAASAGPTVTANAEGGVYDRPTLALVGEAGAEAVVPLKKSRGLPGLGGGVTVHVSVSVDARGQDGEGIAQKIAAALPSAIADAFEGLALEGGVA